MQNQFFSKTSGLSKLKNPDVSWLDLPQASQALRVKRHRARRVSSGLCGAVPRLACIEIGGVALKSVQKSGDSKVSTVLHFPLSTEKQRGGDVFLSQSLELTLTSLQGLKGSNPPSLSPRRWVFGPPTLLAQTPATRFLQLLLCFGPLSLLFVLSPGDWSYLFRAWRSWCFRTGCGGFPISSLVMAPSVTSTQGCCRHSRPAMVTMDGCLTRKRISSDLEALFGSASLPSLNSPTTR